MTLSTFRSFFSFHHPPSPPKLMSFSSCEHKMYLIDPQWKPGWFILVHVTKAHRVFTGLQQNCSSSLPSLCTFKCSIVNNLLKCPSVVNYGRGLKSELETLYNPYCCLKTLTLHRFFGRFKRFEENVNRSSKFLLPPPGIELVTFRLWGESCSDELPDRQGCCCWQREVWPGVLLALSKPQHGT